MTFFLLRCVTKTVLNMLAEAQSLNERRRRRRRLVYSSCSDSTPSHVSQQHPLKIKIVTHSFPYCQHHSILWCPCQQSKCFSGIKLSIGSIMASCLNLVDVLCTLMWNKALQTNISNLHFWPCHWQWQWHFIHEKEIFHQQLHTAMLWRAMKLARVTDPIPFDKNRPGLIHDSDSWWQ